MKLFSALILAVISFAASGQRSEAENGVLRGTQIDHIRPNFSGSGYVTGFDQDGDAVQMTVIVNESRAYRLTVGYAAPYGYKENDIYINGIYAGAQQFPESSGFTEASFGTIFLKKGENQIEIVKTWGYFELDYIEASPAQRNEYAKVSASLINEAASAEAQVLYHFLKDYYGHRIISGQQADEGGEVETEYIEKHTGKIPAVKGFDLIDYSPSRVEHGTNSHQTEKAIEWGELGGIVSLMWHWNAPKDLINSPEQPWWSGFYTRATTFDASIAMNDPESEEYTLILRDIDVIAEELSRIAESKVPVLWRPLHEAEGEWFWWGAKGPKTCSWLWRLMYDRITHHHQIHNLIWVWTGTGSAEALEWYPGDDYVDIIGADIYLANKNYSTSFTLFDKMAGLHDGQKIITMSETGTIPDPSGLDEQKARWSWFCVWSGDFIMDGLRNDVNHLKKVYNHPYIITLDELPDFDNYVSPDFPDDDEDRDEVLGLPDHLSFNAYPNPITEYLTISSEMATTILSAMIYDLKGNQLQQIPAVKSEGEIIIDFTAYPAGIYVVKLTTMYGSKTLKIKKQ